MNSLTLTCPAKVNLYLKVVGRRPDGYHDLVTVMQPLSLADELVLTLRAAAVSLECNQPDLPVDEGNLAVRGGPGLPEGYFANLRIASPVGQKNPGGCRPGWRQQQCRRRPPGTESAPGQAPR